MKPKKLTACVYAFAITIVGFANDIQITNVSLTGQNTTNHTVQVQFTISWQNSWRLTANPANWDAAWVFIKYRQGSGDWGHARLNTDGNHVPPAGCSINTGLITPGAAFNATTNPGVGAFIYRSANGSGPFTVTNAQLQWNYGANGLADNDAAEVQVFAIEMVYVPQSAFAVGDGLNDALQFTVTTINTGNPTTAPTGTGSLGGQGGGYPTGEIAPFNVSWPNGFNAFYSMKYEISQQGYVDFLNSLSRAQQTNRVGTNITSGTTSITNRYVMTGFSSVGLRNGIRCDASIPATAAVSFYCDYDGDGIGGETTDGKDIACNYIHWGDVCAYLDWAGLRPMTELEFEKSGRGNLLPIPGEYAWGNTVIDAVTSLTNPGQSSEKPNIGANASYGNLSNLQGPIRVGSIAGAASNRQQAGAGIYGIMELSGNLYERHISISTNPGRGFVGSHGDGLLNATGFHTNPDWPTIVGYRAGTWSRPVADLRLSERSAAGSQLNNVRDGILGGRGCRSSP